MSNQSFREFEHTGWLDNEVCSNYHEYFSDLTKQSIQPLLDAAQVDDGMSILDVATGAGYVAGKATERGAKAVGVDFSNTQIEIARKSYPEVLFEECDGESLPFPSEHFDAVVNNYGIPHFSDPDAALREAFRVTRSGGRVAFAVWDVPQRTIAFGAIYGAIQKYGTADVGLPVGPSFFLYSDPEHCENSLRSAGFKDPTVAVVDQEWILPSPEALVHAILDGTVRAASTLRGQTPEAKRSIEAAIAEAISGYKREGEYVIPMPAVIASAVKP